MKNFTLLSKFIKIFKKSYYTGINKYRIKAYGKNLSINKKSNLSPKTSIGDDCHFNGMSIGGGGEVTIGNNFHSGVRCQILTQNHNYDSGKTLPYDNSYICKDVVIGNNVWFGNDVTIIPGIKIADGAIIGIGSVVVKDVEYCSIVGGNPAKHLKHRDIQHYEKLISDNSNLKKNV